MIEFSFAELFLLIWAVIATAIAVSASQQMRAAKHFINAILDNDEMRNEVVSSYKIFKAGNK
jgi:F0F1-type ATP synthase membrane subunit c/vacuolar-type H+-ATPase subunit K